jgi:hypothetical protein
MQRWCGQTLMADNIHVHISRARVAAQATRGRAIEACEARWITI